ncbi:hypothetical protein PU463_00029445 [Pseudomonas aeruginosa]
MREGAEYKYVTLGERGEQIILATYGELFSITRQAIINDDLQMLSDIPFKLGRQAAKRYSSATSFLCGLTVTRR